MDPSWREDIPKDADPLKFFVFASRPHLFTAVVSAAAVLFAAILNAIVPYIFKLITDGAAALSRGGSYHELFVGAAAYIIAVAGSELLFRLSGYIGSEWATMSRATARYALTSYVTLHSRGYFSDRFAGSIASKITHASNGMRDLVEYALWRLEDFFVSALASIIIAFLVNPILGLLVVGWVAIVIGINAYFGVRRAPHAAYAQALESRLSGATVDLLGNVSTMQEFVRRPFELDRIRTLIMERSSAGLYNWRYGERLLTVNGMIQTVFGAILVFSALHFAVTGRLSAGDIVLIVTMIFRMRDQMLSIGSHFHRIAEIWGEVRESLEEIIAPHEIVDTREAMHLSVKQGDVVFDHASFAYEAHGKTVLSDFSLSIRGKQKIGLVGKSGAGKSTLVKLLLRHYEVVAGAISVDGLDISAVTLDSLRENIALVPQEPLMFHRTIRENISYGNLKAKDEDIERAAQLAHAHEFIERLPFKYETMVGERGITLSGGERQRIAIARAILKNSPILVLDEATSALDSESEVKIQEALHELMQGKTVIAIAHRLSTLREMDRIVVLDNGKIAEAGTHDELLEKGGRYAELWRHQAGGFLQDR